MSLLESCAIELANTLIHVLAASKGKMLPVEQSPFKSSELDQAKGYFGITDVQEHHMPHLLNRSQLFQSIVSILRSQSSPIVD